MSNGVNLKQKPILPEHFIEVPCKIFYWCFEYRHKIFSSEPWHQRPKSQASMKISAVLGAMLFKTRACKGPYINYVTMKWGRGPGQALPNRFSLIKVNNMGEGLKNDPFGRYVIYGQPPNKLMYLFKRVTSTNKLHNIL